MDDDDNPLSPEEWDEIKPFVDEVFVRIDRPNDVLVELKATLHGDGGSSDVDVSFHGPFSREDRVRLLELMLEVVNRPSRADSLWPDEQ